MAHVHFEVRHEFDAPARTVWEHLVDWAGHADWIPATRVEVSGSDPTAIGIEFTAVTGYGPVALKDRMRVVRCDWDESQAVGDCEVEKIGPVLTGTAAFTVESVVEGHGGKRAVVVWVEDVSVPHAPQFLAPVIGWFGAAGFRFGMRKLAKLIADRPQR